ncbi:type II secretion system minor pseudopilin GspK [Stutzerimonas azotifigens]|uniref:type II secretion system minor pseudopilin GspK n=1 Tax=Stutzerimonas azotifigens TaxID=291995 RepID=UPI000412CA1F|nr:type II secretion system minor pseudopilin GspK [Stutzerimonas azotifigens]
MRRERGVALITVLLVVAIVTVVCAGLIARQQLSIRSTTNQMQARQAWQYALGGEALARAILARDAAQNPATPEPAEEEPPAEEAPPEGAEPAPEQEAGEGGEGPKSVDHLGEAWARPLPAFPIDGGEIRVRIEDLASRFNLNSLTQNQQPNEAAIAQFRRLLLGLQIEAPYAERLVDWLDANQDPSGEYGAEDTAYARLDPPYRTAGRRLYDVSELRLLLGMTEADFRRLAPHVTALPGDVPLNVNTVGARVLASIDDSLTLAAARAAVSERRPGGFRDIAAFLAQPSLAGTELQGTALAVGSQFFQVTSEVRLGDRRMALVSVLRREDDGEVKVMYRNLGLPPRLPRDDEGD